MDDVIEGTALVVRDSAAVATTMPTVTPAEAREAMEQYLAVCSAVLTADDYQEFKERGKVKRFKKKSAVKKLQTFWSVSVKVRDVQRDDLGDGHFGFRVIATASMPSGRVVEATGGCATFEERFDLKRYDDESDFAYAARSKKALARSYHDVMSTAETRATNRAVMNCIGVGGGEVTADELSRERDPQPTQRRAAAQPTATDLLIARARDLGAIPVGSREQGIVALKNWATAQGIEWGPGAATKIDAALLSLEAPEPPPAPPNAPKTASAPQTAAERARRLNSRVHVLFAACGIKDAAARSEVYGQFGYGDDGKPFARWSDIVAAGKEEAVIAYLTQEVDAVKGVPAQ